MQVTCDMMRNTFARSGIRPYTDALDDAMQVACDMMHNTFGEGSKALISTWSFL